MTAPNLAAIKAAAQRAIQPGGDVGELWRLLDPATVLKMVECCQKAALWAEQDAIVSARDNWVMRQLRDAARALTGDTP